MAKDKLAPAIAVVAAVGVVGVAVAYKQGWLGKLGITEVVSVEDPAGNGIAQAVVKLVELGVQGVTDDTGQVKFTGIQSGTYTLSATATGYQANSKQITITASGADSITLTPSVTKPPGGPLAMTLSPTTVKPPAAVDFILQGGVPTGSWIISAIKPDGVQLQLASGVFDGQGQASGQMQFVNTQGGYGGAISANPPGVWVLTLTAGGKTTQPIALSIGGTPTNYPAPVASAVLPDGTSSSTAQYLVGQDIRMSVKVPSNEDPAEILGYIDGVAGNPLPWNPAVTGYDFVLDYGAAPLALVGHHAFYALVTFSNGVQQTSNVITFDVVQLGQITVKVLSSYDNGPVIGARVSLGGQTAYTDANGNASFTGLQVGTATLAISASGFNPLSEPVSITLSTSLISATLVGSFPGR